MQQRLFRLLALTSAVLGLCADSSLSQFFAWRRSLAANTWTVGINPRNTNSVYAQASSGRLAISYNGGTTWTERGNPGLGFLRQILVHPSDTNVILVAAFSGGLRRSSDYGMTWALVLPNFGIDGESIAYDPHHPDTLYAGNYSDASVYQSTDRGLTWRLVSRAGSRLCTIAIRPDSSAILLAGTGSGRISKSTDHGTTWRLVKETGSDEIPKIVINPTQPRIAYAAGFAGPDSTIGVWKTTDGGEHWLLTSLRGISLWSLDLCASAPQIVYAGTFSDTHDAAYRTADGGTSWDTLKTGFPGGGDSWSLKVDPDNANRVWQAIGGTTRSGIYRWVPLRARVEGTVRDAATNQPVTLGVLRLLSTGDSLPLDPSGYYSFDYFDGDSVRSPLVHIEAYPFYIRDEQITFVLDTVVSHDIYLQRLARARVSGSVRAVGTQQPLGAIATLYANSRFGASFQQTTTNASGSFQIPDAYITYPPIVWYDSLLVDPVFPFAQRLMRNIVIDTSGLSLQFLLDTADVLVVSTTRLENFLGYNAFQGFYRSAFDSLALSAHIWYRVGRGFAPARRAAELRKRTAIYYTGSDSAGLFPQDRDSLIAAMQAGVHIFITGQNFVEKNDTLARAYIGVRHGGNTSNVFVRGTIGDLFDGFTFGTSGGSSAGNQSSRDLMIVENPRARVALSYGLLGGEGTAAVRLDSLAGGGKLLLFGFGFEAINSASGRANAMRRIIGYFDGSIVLDVDSYSDEVPVHYALEQNYPNPFNASTVIAYHVPRGTRHTVSLHVFDVLGREVATLVNDRLAPGRYTVRWEATDQASGVYICRMRAGSFVASRKLLLLR